MSQSVDERVVKMTFNNSKFEQNAQTTLNTLDKLKSALNMDGASKSLAKLESQTKGFTVASITNGVEELQVKFNALGIAATAVIADIATTLTHKLGGALNKVVSQIKTGGMNRALNLEQARFSMQGLLYDTNEAGEQIAKFGITVDDVMRSGGPVQNAVSGTAYGLDEAAKAASNFIASGITDLDKLESALSSISGSAAQTGASYEEIAHIYQRIAGNGRVYAIDLQSFSARGVNAAAALADVLGKTEEEVRDMVSKGKIDFETFSDAMYQSFGENAFRANETFNGALSNMKAALSRFGAKFATPYLENMRDIFNALRPMINAISASLDPLVNRINKFLTTLKEFAVVKIDGLTNFFESFTKIPHDTRERIEDLSNGLSKIDRMELARHANPVSRLVDAFDSLVRSVKNFGAGLKNIFGPLVEHIASFVKLRGILEKVTGVIEKISEKFKAFSESTEATTKVIEPLKKVITAMAKVFEVFKAALMAIGKVVKEVVGPIFESLGFSVLGASSSIADIVIKISDFILESGIFQTAANAIIRIFKEMKKLAGPISEGFSKIKDSVLGLFSGLSANISGASVLDKIGTIIEKFADIVSKVVHTLFENISFSDITKGMLLQNIGFGITAIGALFKELEALYNTISGSMNRVSSLKLGSLRSIATTLLILAGAIAILSLIDPVELAASTAALSALMAMLTSTVKALSTGTLKDAAGLMITLQNLQKLGIALLMLAVAVKLLSSCNWEDLAKGIMSVGILMALLSAYVHSVKDTKMMKGAISVIAVALAIDMLVIAVKKLGELDIDSLLKGLSAVGILLAEIGLFSMALSKGNMNISSGIGLLATAAGLLIIASAVKSFASIDTNSLVIGLTAIGVALAAIGVFAIALQNTNLLSIGAGLLIVSAALVIMSSVIQNLAALSIEQIITGLVGLAGALLIIVLALNTMPKDSILTAASMVVMSAAIMILSGALAALGSIPIGNIVVALVSLAATIAIFAAAAFLLGPVIPSMLALGAALALVGVGTLAFAAGIALLTPLLSEFAAALSDSLVVILEGINKILPLIVETMVVLITAVLQSIEKTVPQLLHTLGVLLDAGIEFILKYVPKLAETGIKLLLSLLHAIDDNIQEVVETAISIVVNFINGVANKLPDVINAGFNLLLSFIYGIADAVRNNSYEVGQAAWDLIEALITGAIDAIAGFFNDPIEKLKELGQGMLDGLGEFINFDEAWDKIKSFFDGIGQGIADFFDDPIGSICDLGSSIVDGFCDILGINSPSTVMIEAGHNIIAGLTNGLEDNESVTSEVDGIGTDILKKLDNSINADNASDMSESMIEGMLGGFKKLSPELYEMANQVADNTINRIKGTLSPEAFDAIGVNMMAGMEGGLLRKAESLKATVVHTANNIIASMKNTMGIASPSKVFYSIGSYCIQGLENGLSDSKPVEKQMSKLGRTLSDDLSNVLDNIDDVRPTIQPVLDLSQIQNGVSRMNGMLDSDYGLAGSISSNLYDSKRQNATDVILGKLNDMIRMIGEGFNPDDIYNAVREGASDAQFNVALDGRKITSTVNGYNTKHQISNARFAGV